MTDRVDAVCADDEDMNNMASTEQQAVPEPMEPDVFTRGDYPSLKYAMDGKTRGKALIIENSFHEEHRTGLRFRKGSSVDKQNVSNLLHTMGFENDDVTFKEDLTYADFKGVFEKESQKDYKDANCFVCIILSYGAPGFVYGMDKKVGVNSLVKYFKGDKCKSLAGKPKLFFIQTCPPKKIDAPNAVAPQGTGDENDRIIPIEADILLIHSCVPGLLTWKHDNGQGSLFITSLVEVMREQWREKDLLTMLTLMQKKIKEEFKKREIPKTKIPFISSTLWKDLYFNPHLAA